ncbi:MAG: class I SAM-dependent methyltransferase, partial [Mycoplasmataceae bacterium]|nr:class I SAM-dependent methyltransferase [Mycoplasmataceae bacterium]
MDILGEALIDFWNKKYTEDIITTSNITDEDEMPLPYLFRRWKDMPELEQIALNSCKGNVLDIGCGSGSHSLELQNKNIVVTALDISKGACRVATARGVKNVVNYSLENFEDNTFDTLLLLMNGIGLAETIENLPNFLNKLKSLLNVGGQIILDSSDIAYMYEDEDGGTWLDLGREYYGELTFEMHYKKQSSDKFDWLYIDFP